MAEGFSKVLCILIGAIMVIVGIGGVPLAVLAGEVHKLVLYTVLLFAGIGILGWANK